jgi:hypothetical protein
MEPPIESKPQKTETRSEMPHSKLGIASFIISLNGGVLWCLTFAVAATMGAVYANERNSLSEILIGGIGFGVLIVLLTGLGLGIAGLLQKNRKKIFAILGTVFSSVIIISFLIIMGVGITAVLSGKV